MSKIKLSNRELDIMLVLWNSKQPLAATDIPKINSSLSINTIQVVLKNLLKRSYIKIADIVYHGTVLTRSYVPVLTQEEYILSQIQHTQLSLPSFIATLVKNEKDEKNLIEIENLIEEQKRKIREESE